ncbi:MAG: Gfo/Idh/MocA family oxidoreductase [Ruminococcaceae bacterium]|nr:Gfo/Idh/MocA family oxidoreductase [Oscillospiraceae bacterium]
MLKFGMIGVGKICQGCHLPAYDKINDVEIVALCDINEERLKEVGKKYPNARLYSDYKEMINKEELDAVDICTPNNIHSQAAIYALDKGLHVMCEKPDAVSVSEAEKMKAAAEKSGKTLMVMRNNRYRPSTKFLKQYIAEGKMGKIYAGRCGWIRRRGIPGWGGWFTDKAQAGGGPLIDLGVHIIDLSMYLMGNAKPVTVSGCTYLKFPHTSYSKIDVEDLAMGFIRFDNGACLQIEFSWASNIPGDQMFVELRGTKAGSRMSGIDRKFEIFTEECGVNTYLKPDIDDYNCPPHHEQNIRHFIDVINGKAEPDFTPEQGLNMVKILEALYKSAELGHEIEL